MCINPIPIQYERFGQIHSFGAPCGKCIECVDKYQKDWMLRLCAESDNWRYCSFMTLTYDNENLPYVPLPESLSDESLSLLSDRVAAIPPNEHLSRNRANLNEHNAYLHPDNIEHGIPIPVFCREHVVNWLKASREAFFRDFNERGFCKYFVCSEYGPNTLRPHYHVLLFHNCMPYLVRKYFFDTWKYGTDNKFCEVDNTHGLNGDFGKMSRYVAKYCVKSPEFENPYVLEGVAPKPFRLISLGIGSNLTDELRRRLSNCPQQWSGSGKYGDYYGYKKEYLEWILQTLKVNSNGYFYNPPRYNRERALYPSKTVLRPRWSNTQKAFVNVAVKVPNKETRLSYALDHYLLDKSIEDYNSLYRQLQTAHPAWTDVQISLEICRIERDYQQEKIDRLVSRHHSFYFGNFLKSNL